jgi:hypothetical protein
MPKNAASPVLSEKRCSGLGKEKGYRVVIFVLRGAGV